eukprot:Rmarinus@m.26911
MKCECSPPEPALFCSLLGFCLFVCFFLLNICLCEAELVLVTAEGGFEWGLHTPMCCLCVSVYILTHLDGTDIILMLQRHASQCLFNPNVIKDGYIKYVCIMLSIFRSPSQTFTRGATLKVPPKSVFRAGVWQLSVRSIFLVTYKSVAIVVP